MKDGKKKVLFASRDLSVGGMEKALLMLLNKLDFSRCDVTLILERAEGALLSELDSRVRVREFKVSSAKPPLLRKAINFSRQLAFRITDGKKYDFSCCYATYSTPCERIAKAASSNSLLYVHSDYLAMYGGDRDKTKEFFDSIGITDYRKAAFVSQAARDGAASLYPAEVSDRFFTLGNLVDCERIRELAEEPCDVRRPDNKKVFIFVGRLDDSSKKLKRLIDASKIAASRGFSFEVWIVGDGPDGEMYRKYAEEIEISSHVRFFGEKINPYPYIKNADCLILTSDYEGFPVVYGEAMALNKGIITTVPASDGYITVDGAAASIADRTPEAVAEAMLAVISGGELNKKCYDCIEINAKKMQNLYELMDV